MKFNAVVGNPPYQISKDGTSDSPVYHLFFDAAFTLSKRVSFISPARFLFNAGKTPSEWNNKVLNDAHFKVIRYESQSTKVFPNVDIKGGVAITLRDENQDFGKILTYTSYPELNSIRKKVTDLSFCSIEHLIFGQNKFNLEVLYTDYPEYKTIIGSKGKERRLTTSIFEQLNIFTAEQKNVEDICIIGLIKNNRVKRYIPKKYLDAHENLDFYKVIVPKSNGSGAIGEVLSTPLIGEPLIGEPLIGYTQSFIGIGNFTQKDEAIALLKYIKSKFARTMLGILKVTQDNSKEVWKFVPLQDFTDKSDIDWSKSVAEIDQQLYKKYNLDDSEIAFIESMIKPME